MYSSDDTIQVVSVSSEWLDWYEMSRKVIVIEVEWCFRDWRFYFKGALWDVCVVLEAERFMLADSISKLTLATVARQHPLCLSGRIWPEFFTSTAQFIFSRKRRMCALVGWWLLCLRCVQVQLFESRWQSAFITALWSQLFLWKLLFLATLFTSHM